MNNKLTKEVVSTYLETQLHIAIEEVLKQVDGVPATWIIPDMTACGGGMIANMFKYITKDHRQVYLDSIIESLQIALKELNEKESI